MAEDKTEAGEKQGLWSRGSAENWRWREPDTPLIRFLGGTPVNVALRLFFLSLVVGALMMWLDIRPADIVQGVVHFVQRFWGMGFRAVRELATYFVAGAVIVVPIWLVFRLFNMRGPR